MIVDGLEVLVAQGAAAFELWTGVPAPVEVDAPRRRACRRDARAHDRRRVARPRARRDLTGLPAGLVLDREAIDADLARRQQGYGRSPRQQLEQDRVEVLAGLRHGRTLGTPLALVVGTATTRTGSGG